MITPREVVDIALTRTVSVDHFTQSDIQAAVWHYVRGYLGTDLYAEIVDNIDDYEEFIKDYIKPVLAYGIVVNAFERFTSEVSDRGVVQMLSEGATVIDSDSRSRTKQEFMEILVILLEKMTTHCDFEKKDNNPLFELYDDQDYDYTGFSSNAYVNRNTL
jgi:hypothetical protein